LLPVLSALDCLGPTSCRIITVRYKTAAILQHTIGMIAIARSKKARA
jgi:hypothetical protein